MRFGVRRIWRTPWIELEVFGGKVELNLRDAIGIQILARRNPRNRLRSGLGSRGHRCFPPGVLPTCFYCSSFCGMQGPVSVRENRSLAKLEEMSMETTPKL